MEDYCWQCVQDWKKRRVHFDLWIGDTIVPEGRELIECQVALTDQLARTTDTSRVFVHAPPGLPVNVTVPLFDRSTSTCAVPMPSGASCKDEGNIAGNWCQFPTPITCQQAADTYKLPLSRFLELNPKLKCASPIPVGKAVAVAGSCGG